MAVYLLSACLQAACYNHDCSPGYRANTGQLADSERQPIYSSLFTRNLVAIRNKHKNIKNKRTKNRTQKHRTWCREYTKCYKSTQVITQYACQLASATNDIWFIFTKYTTELRDCTMFKQQTVYSLSQRELAEIWLFLFLWLLQKLHSLHYSNKQVARLIKSSI